MSEENKQDTNTQTSASGSTTKPEVHVEISKVASNPKKSLAIIAVAVLVSMYLVYSIFKGDAEEKQKIAPQDTVEKPKVVTKPTQELDSADIPVLPTLPQAPKLQDPTATPPKQNTQVKNVIKNPKIPPKAVVKQPAETIAPPIVKKLETPPTPSLGKDTDSASKKFKFSSPPRANSAEDQQQMAQRKKSGIMLLAGTQPKSQEEIEQDAAFTKRNNLEYVLTRGKLLDAVLESAINTDFSGADVDVRAVISRDVYSESGKIVLIPKGSRLFGTFTSTVDSVYGRINISWQRIDLPTGYSLNFGGAAIDNLGRRGTQGRLDNKIQEKLGGVILSTALNVAFSKAVDKLVPPEQTGNQSAQAQSDATGIQSAVQAVYNDATIADTNTKLTSMCNAARGAITNTASTTYQQVSSICLNPTSNPTGAADAARLTNLYTSLMQAANTGLTTAAVNSTPSKAQEATKAGVEEFSKAVKEVLEQVQPKPTVTIDQGEAIKIYVNKDYKFPKAAVSQSRLLQ